MTTVDTISLDTLLFIAVEAGKKILDIYNSTVDVASITETKSDQSPLTLADKLRMKLSVKGFRLISGYTSAV
jgi:3'-phosphoadenosine 5'-phosphosulfate (PAPS) 3'-phosphatase